MALAAPGLEAMLEDMVSPGVITQQAMAKALSLLLDFGLTWGLCPGWPWNTRPSLGAQKDKSCLLWPPASEDGELTAHVGHKPISSCWPGHQPELPPQCVACLALSPEGHRPQVTSDFLFPFLKLESKGSHIPHLAQTMQRSDHPFFQILRSAPQDPSSISWEW